MAYVTRRATPDDSGAISALLTKCGGTPKYRRRFGVFNMATFLECGYMPLVCFDVDGELRLFVVFGDAPKSVPSDKAQDWLDALGSMSLGNTLFCEFCVAEQTSGAEALASAARFAVVASPQVDHLLLCLEQQESPLPNEFALFSSLTENVCHAARSQIMPTLAVRRASVEDSDDLLPVFESQSEVLSANFGDFFLAEMIEAQDDVNKALVGEVNGRAVGLLAGSTDIDTDTLNCCFQLAPFHGLMRKQDYIAAGPAPAEGKAPTTVSNHAQEGDASLLLEEAKVPNVFAVTLFCLDEAYESRSLDFFGHMFALFPDREYCAVTAPPLTSSQQKPPAFLDWGFTRVAPKAGSTFSHTLFLLHRDFLLAPLSLRVTRYSPEEDARGVAALFPHADGVLTRMAADSETLIEQDGGPSSAGFVAKIHYPGGSLIVAAGLLSGREASTQLLQFLKANYHIEDVLPFERHRARAQATLQLFSANPTFAGAARFVLKEMMRLYQKTALYHLVDASTDMTPQAVLREMALVRPRWRPSPRPEDETEDTRRKPGLEEGAESRGEALHFLARSAVSTPVRRNHSRIVVAGASTCGLALLSELLVIAAREQVDFSELTLLSPCGLRQHPSKSDGLSDDTDSVLGSVDEDFPASFEYEAAGLQQRCRVVKASFVAIDRPNKALVLPDGSLLLYDVLVLTTGLQETTALCLRSRVSEELVSTDDEEPVVIPQEPCCLEGFLSLSDYQTPLRVRLALRAGRVVGGDAPLIMVYGGTIAALGCVRALLDQGQPPSRISLVMPGKAPDSLGDAVVDRVALSTLIDAGVTTRFSYTLKSLRHSDDKQLVAALFEDSTAPEKVVEMPTAMLLGSDALDVSTEVYDALDSAGLVYDGRLVVDEGFRTTDKAVYACGRHTKFSQVHRAAIAHNGGGPEALWHQRFNSLEVGAHVARCIVTDLVYGQQEAERRVLPRFLKARTVSALLPGGLHYARTTMPRIPAACKKLPTGIAPDSSGVVAGSKSLSELAKNRSKYSVLKMDEQGAPCDLVYLGREAVEPRNLAKLVQTHESYLNSAQLAYEKGVVDDWVSFFREDWTTAISFDRFAPLQSSLRELLEHNDGAREIVASLLIQLDAGKDDETLRQMRYQAVGKAGDNLPKETKDLLTNMVVGYLRKNKALLPNFALPTPQTTTKNANK